MSIPSNTYDITLFKDVGLAIKDPTAKDVVIVPWANVVYARISGV